MIRTSARAATLTPRCAGDTDGIAGWHSPGLTHAHRRIAADVRYHSIIGRQKWAEGRRTEADRRESDQDPGAGYVDY